MYFLLSNLTAWMIFIINCPHGISSLERRIILTLNKEESSATPKLNCVGVVKTLTTKKITCTKITALASQTTRLAKESVSV